MHILQNLLQKPGGDNCKFRHNQKDNIKLDLIKVDRSA